MKSQNKHRDFRFNGFKFTIVESNNSNFKWQAMVFSEHYNAWVRIDYYSSTQYELKEIVKRNYRNL